MTRHLKHIIFFILATLLITGCVSHPDLPKNWGSNTSSDNGLCLKLNGTYNNTGERGNPIKNSPLPKLTSSLFKYTDNLNLIETVSIKHGDKNKIHFVALFGDSSISSRTIEATCKDNEYQVAVIEQEGFINREGVLGYENSSLFLRKSSDGSLIIRSSSFGTAIMLLIPVASSQWHWHRYSNIDF